MKNKLLLKILIFAIFSFFSYIVFMLYLLSGDTKEYEKHCSKYIPILEAQYTETASYPKNVATEFKYSLQECGYRIVEKNSFTFSVSAGLGVGGYESKERKCWHD